MGEIRVENAPAHVSWSALETWMTCGKKFELQRLLKVEQRPSWAALGGSAVHGATEDVDHKRHAEREAPCADARPHVRFDIRPTNERK